MPHASETVLRKNVTNGRPSHEEQVILKFDQAKGQTMMTVQARKSWTSNTWTSKRGSSGAGCFSTLSLALLLSFEAHRLGPALLERPVEVCACSWCLDFLSVRPTCWTRF